MVGSRLSRVVSRRAERQRPPPAASRVYELTEWGAELRPIVLALGIWGARSPVLKPEGELRADSLMLSLLRGLDPAMFASARVFEVRLGKDAFTVSTRDAVRVSRDQVTGPVDTVIDIDTETMGALMAGETDVDSVVEGVRVRLDGDVEAGRALLAAVSALDVSAA
ncbi:SCP2 sterol-binding domain-containing protein [Saccharothrix sp.]|uniref:winged helix-turn-helix transcriptional regulator n=1 Tax=Saccharothrix sp. TaxID=1873460 RepID=UPI0028122843|nr:hypothetical protein [Saccharothrix sp.]